MTERVVWCWDGRARVLDVDRDEGDMTERAHVDVSDMSERAAMALMLNLSHSLPARRNGEVRRVRAVSLGATTRETGGRETPGAASSVAAPGGRVVVPLEGVTSTPNGGRRLPDDMGGKLIYRGTLDLLRAVIADPGHSGRHYNRVRTRGTSSGAAATNFRHLRALGMLTMTGARATALWYPTGLGERLAAT